jgi:DoxX-like family
METTLQNPALVGTKINPKTINIAYWMVTALFCLEMSFTAYYELLPQGAEAFARLGFPASYFRMELSLAKLAGVAALLIPMVPARVKEWAYAGFAINLVSALITHLSLGQGPQSWGPSAITSVFWGLSYFLWLRLSSPGSGSLARGNQN